MELEPDALREVVARAVTRDPDAWEQLYRHCHPRLFSYACRRLPTHEAADDAVSETMTRALRRIDDFTWQGAGFDAWMYGIARNVVLESRRSDGRRSALADRQIHEARTDARGDEVDPETVVSVAGERAMVRAAFERLSDDDKEILELRIVGGLTADAVADVVGKRPGAVRMAQSRALDRLRIAVKELDDA